MIQDRREYKDRKEKLDQRDPQAHKDRKVRRAFKEKLDLQDHKELFCQEDLLDLQE